MINQKPSYFKDINKPSNMKKHHLILSENGFVLSYQFFISYDEILKMPKTSILWFINIKEREKWKASIDRQHYFGSKNIPEFLSDLEKKYPECAEWLLFNMEWLK